MWQKILHLVLLHNVLFVKSECIISLERDLTISQARPLLLNPAGGSGINAFYLPNNQGVITLSDGEFINLACPHGKIVLDDTPTTSDTGKVTCINGTFVINQRDIIFSSITCTRHAEHTASHTGKTCGFNYSEVEIGFTVEYKFLKLYTVCFDLDLQIAAYAKNVISKAVAAHSPYPNILWLQDSDFYTINDVNNLYMRSKQRAAINSLLGLDPSSDKYIALSGDFYLSRGHLAPRADFIYGSQQRATFYLINSVPKWQIFKTTNWLTLEQNVRRLAERRGVDLTVYTGTYGVATLPHEITGEDVELYLFVEDSFENSVEDNVIEDYDDEFDDIDDVIKAIPVPRLVWKVVYEPITQAGVVFIGVNNPYFSSVEDVICTNICKKYKWLTWDAFNSTLGYGYCCRVSDFRKTVKTFPDITVTKLLK